MSTAQGSTFNTLQAKVASAAAAEQEKIDFAVLAGERKEAAARDLLYTLLDDESEDVRYYALRALVLDALDRSTTAERKCWDLFDHDPNGRVRAMAAVCVGSLRSGSKDPTTFARLKRRVAEAADRFESEAALEALYNLVGRPPREWPTQRRILGGRIGASPPEIEVQVNEASALEVRFLGAAGDQS